MSEATKKLRQEHELLKKSMSDLRRAGYDLFAAQMKEEALSSKIQMAEATEEQKDLAKAQALLSEVQSEIKESMKEMFKKAPTTRSVVEGFIKQANDALGRQDRQSARDLYLEVSHRFAALPPEDKKEVMPACKELLARLK